MKNIFKKSLFVVTLLVATIANALATDIVWDFSEASAQSFTNNSSYSFMATDGTTEMRYTAGSSDGIVAKSGNKMGYLKENGTTGGGSAKDVDGTTAINKNRLIRLFVTGTGKLTINCTDNVGTYKIYDGQGGTVLADAYNANTTSSNLTVSNLLWIETSKKGYINSITWTPSSGEGDEPGGGDTPGGDTPGGGDDPTPQPSGDAYAHWRFSGSDAPAIGSSESGTKMTVKFLAKDDSKTYSKESAGYNAAVPDDMKSQGSNGIKMGGNVLYLMVTVDGGFKAKDVVSICGYNPWKVSSTEEHSGDIAASVATGTSKTDYNIGTFTLTADASALYMMRAEGSGTCICAIKVTRDGGETPSDPIPVESVTLDVTSVVMDINDTKQLTATVTPSNATDKTVTWSSSDITVATVDDKGLVTAIGQGSATITATSNMDNTKKATCTVTVNPPAAPIEVESISIKEATTIAIGSSETLSVTYTPSDANTGKAITWTSDKETVATVDANGKVTGIAAGTAVITATSEKGKTASCTVTVEAVAVTGVSLNKTTLTITEGETSTLTANVQPSNATNKNVSWSSDNTAVATVSASGVVTGVTVGTATITVTTEDGNKTATCTVTVKEASPVPQTDLSLHVPEKYEAKEMAGGYNTPLVNFNQREYEVFYFGKSKPAGASGDIAVTYTLNHKGGYLVSSPSGSGTSMTAKDGWFKAQISSLEGSFKDASEIEEKAPARDEFSGLPGDLKLKNNNTFELYIQGYDQFSIVAQDKKIDTKGTTPSDNRYWEVYIDSILQPQYFNKDNATTRRYDITTGKHVITLKAIGGEDSKLYGFSLRVAQEPRTKWLTGNDSTQSVLANNAIKPVTYVTKYNNIEGAETKLEWIGTEVEGIELQKIEGALTDTLVLSGIANAPAGEYNYAVVAYYNGVETSRAEGKFYVKYQIKAITETNIDADQGDEMDDIKFKYNVYDETTDIIFQWINDVAAPGVTTNAKNGAFIISGTPTATGLYSYLITVIGGDTITGSIDVKSADLGVDPILYLYKNEKAYNNDYIYTYLKEVGYNLKEKKTKEYDIRPASQFAKYKWILISEDVDANNVEIFKMMRGDVNLPILNMKAFSYSHSIDSLTADTLKYPYDKEWGEANNGSLSENGKSITVLRDDHPIFKELNKKQGDKIQILDSIDRRGLMPIKVTKQGSLCLATAWTRDREDYYGDGVQETFLHEMPAEVTGRAKYICFPIAMNSSKYMTDEGKNLLIKVIQYLTGSEASVSRPFLKIESFKIGDVEGKIYESQEVNTITLEIDTLKHPELKDLSAVVPEIEVKDPYTHTTCDQCKGDTADLSIAQYLPVNYVVTDYIQRMVYEVTVVYRKPQGIEEVYTAGQWVNIYDLFGRKVATTNEDIYTMSLPRGIYIIVTENGQTLKISR